MHGTNIIIPNIPYKPTIVYFSGTLNAILSDSWYSAKERNEYEERLGILQTAAKIILEDIRSQNCDNDTSLQTYVRKVIPESLQYFLKCVNACRGRRMKTMT